MRNMALPKEIETERRASLVEIEKGLLIELKNIDKETEVQLSSLKAEKTIGEEKERVASALETAEKKRIALLLAKDAEIEQLATQIEEIKSGVSTKTEAERTKALILAEADGLEKRNKILANYSESALEYELINRLPEIYKSLKIGDLTLFQSSSGEQTCEIDKIGYLFGSLVPGLGSKFNR